MRPVTIIVSDLHVGGGAADPGDDHVYQKSQFRTLIEEIGASAEGKRGDVELFINGDFLEFAQVGPDVYTLGSATYWCSQAESVAKLQPILDGHKDIFDALKQFQDFGNQVTIAAGNHDVDFWWGGVQSRIRSKVGDVSFALGDVWYPRYDGRLLIGHGHMFDPANKFKQWNYPILQGPNKTERLEMCAGTLFMVKFVNWLEQKYPFSDNIKPVTGLGRILWKENKMSLGAVSWMLSRFIARHPNVAMGHDPDGLKFGKHLQQSLQYDSGFAGEITKLYQDVRDANATVETVRAALKTEDDIFNFLLDLLPKLPPERCMPVLDKAPGSTSLGIDSKGTTLQILKAGISSDKEILRIEAEKKMAEDKGPEVVVMGHTHQPDTYKTDRGIYYNPGSWTRYADLAKVEDLTLSNLAREEDFPYQLNYVRVEKTAKGSLASQMICYEQG